MRTALVLLGLAVLTAPALATHGVHGPDGVTAKIVAPAVYDGSAFDVEVTTFRNVGGAWSQVQLGSVLRIFVHDGSAERDVHSKYFVSSATAPVTVRVPAGVVTGGFVDTFVTFSELEGNPVPTSHVNPARNALIDAGAYDAADGLDYHANVRGVAAP